MIAAVLIEYSVKLLDKTFDYLVDEKLKNEIKVGQKVLVPFGNKIVEGFVLEIKNEKDKNIEYKSIIEIVEKNFCLNKELLELGHKIQKMTLSTLISAYQIMFPKALKASNKTVINIKTKTMVILNEDININNYLEKNQRKKKEIEIINRLKNEKEIERKEINCPALRNLIDNKIVVLKEIEIKRSIEYTKENKKEIKLTANQENAFKISYFPDSKS